jgi:hypothetical protein
MIAYDYAYDFANHPYQSEFIDQDSGILTQSVSIPEGVSSVHSLRVKLSKYGEPGPLFFRLGREHAPADLVRGMIPAGDVLPVFELLVGSDFPPIPVQAGEVLFLNLWVEQGRQPLDAYRVYGPNTRHELVDEVNCRVPHWWHQYAERLDDVNAPLPSAYAGAAYPDYAGGSRTCSDGSRTWSISFNLLTDLDPEGGEKSEQQFEFARQLLQPPFVEWVNLRDKTRAAGAGEVMLDPQWAIQNHAGDSQLIRHSIEEAYTFLVRVMDVSLIMTPEGDALNQEYSWGDRRKIITFELAPLSPGMPEPPNQAADPETFRVEISSERLRLLAAHERGLMRAVYWLEDCMLAERAPVLPTGSFYVRPKYSLRMVPGIYPAPSYFMLREAQVWTPGYLWRLSRAGYNAVYFQASLEDFVEHSEIFPELDDPEAPEVIERLKRCVELGAEYGVDFYWDIKTGYERKFPETVYQRIPEIKAFEKFGNFPCTGQPIVLDFLKETIRHVFTAVEKLKGAIVVYDTEGFYSCITHNSKDKCPYCRNFAVEELSTRLFEAVHEAVRVLHTDRELILWTYICDEPWNYRVISAIPASISLAACYSQLKELDRGGVKILTDDYSLCSDKPSDYFLKVQKIARQKGLRFLAKTEDTFGQEFVSTPFTPCLEQHQRRWDSLAEEHVDGFMSQYLHIGFMPTPCQELMRQNVFDVWKDGIPQAHTPEEKLKTAAIIQFGKESVDAILQAWEAFSVAIREYYPYTWGVCRYPGPLQSAPGQPFYLDPSRPMPRPWARGYVNDLKWTGIVTRFLVDKHKTWDERVVARCFQGAIQWYALGNHYLEEALRTCKEVDRQAISATLHVAQMQYYQMKTVVNLIAFIPVRQAYSIQPTPLLMDALVYVLQSELENSLAALRLARRDSRLGFSCEGDGNVRGGHFNAYTIEQKVADLRQSLDKMIN